ncbi:MAG: hypothetical protein JNK49_14875 [Planctomycetes bacterium]|nr:hypothetical protein [Planctomycetota bacterium]
MATAVAAQTQPSVSLPWTQAAIEQFVQGQRERTLAAVASRGLELPADFVAWIDRDPVRQATVYGCRREPLPVLLMLRSLEIDLGAEVVRGEFEPQALAFAMHAAYAAPRAAASPWNDGDHAAALDWLPDVTPRPPLELSIPGDPRRWVDTKAADRVLDRDDHIVNFLEDHAPIEVEVEAEELPPLEYDERGVAKPRGKARKVKQKVLRGLVGADVIASASLQREFGAYLAARGHPEVQIDCGERAVHWFATEAVGDPALRQRIAAAHELFVTAYRNKGRLPQERDRAPTAAESLAWFVRNARTVLPHRYPLFPLQAPWPLWLMLAADDQPLREREAIWQEFVATGTFRTYGEYIGGIAQQFDMQSARRVAPLAFAYGSIQMMWKDGGVCGTMGNIGARTYRILGVPASTAGQPGHCAIVYFEQDAKTGRFRCRGGQYATGGDEVTTVHAGWHYDDVGGRRPMVFHQSVAMGVNRGLDAFVRTLVLRRMFDAARARGEGVDGPAFVAAAMALNPFALAAVVGAIEAAADAPAAMAVLAAFEAGWHAQSRSDDRSEDTALYAATVRDLVHARVLALPAPVGKAANEALLAALERQGCADALLLARTWRAVGGEGEFGARTKAAVVAYLGSAERSKGKRAGEQFAARLSAWAKTVSGREPRRAWAALLLGEFVGREQLQLRGKPVLDPAVERLRKLAGE